MNLGTSAMLKQGIHLPCCMRRAGDIAATAVRRILAAEWKLYRDIRFRSLSADPSAFCTTAEEESSKDESHWIEMARFAASSDSEALWLALRGEMAVGIAGIYLEDGSQKVIWILLNTQK